jgi:hypothetical protein
MLEYVSAWRYGGVLKGYCKIHEVTNTRLELEVMTGGRALVSHVGRLRLF